MHVAVVAKLNAQFDQTGTKFGLLTDIDRTYVVQDGPAKYQASAAAATHQLTAYLASHSIPAIAVTSRDLSSLQLDRQRGLLPLFDAALPALGTECYDAVEDNYAPVPNFSAELGIGPGWRERAEACCVEFERGVDVLMDAGSLPLEARPCLQPRDLPGGILGPQPYKISYNYYGDGAVTEVLKGIFKESIRASSVPIEAVFSYDGSQTGRPRHNIDVLPVSKRGAAEHFTSRIERAVPDVQWIVAGDSKNDEEALVHVGDGAVVVGAYRSDLAVERLRGATIGDGLYAQGQTGRRIVYIEPGDKVGAASLLAGLKLVTDQLTRQAGPRVPRG